MLMTFQTYPAWETVTFTCTGCGKPKRKRTFRHECTVNPFNKNAAGDVCSPTEVRAQSVALVKRDLQQFRREPLCLKCEDALSYTERKALFSRRKTQDVELCEPTG
jgi:hypothetical protein